MTRRETEIYNYIVLFINEHGYPPTINDISKGEYTSRSFARNVVNKLCDYNLIDYNPKIHRSIKLKKSI